MVSRGAAIFVSAIVTAFAAGAACHHSPAAPSGSPPVSDTSTLPQLPCAAPTSGQSGPTYYVAINEAGADDAKCDGSSPVDRGNGHCPFKDFASARTFALLRNVAGVRVEVRTGVYTFPDEGLSLEGTGTSESGRIVLTAYQNDEVVFDGRGVLREVIRMGGRFTALERVTVRNSAAYNVQIGGGSDHLVQCTRFGANVASDSLKGVDGASRTTVRGNDFTQWDSQAIDMTAVRDWTIVNNEIHDPKNATGNAVGMKFGSRGVVLNGNHFRNTRGIAFGGVSSAHSDDYEAYDLVADRNTFENVPGPMVRYYSCSNCTFRNNDGKSVGGGFVLFGEQTDGPSGCAGGCRPTQGATISGNRLTDLIGTPANTFWGLYRHEAAGLSASGNLYCVPGDQTAKFRLDDQDLNFADWTSALGTDATSRTARTTDGVCNAW